MFTFLLSHSQRCSYVMSRTPEKLCRGHCLCLHSTNSYCSGLDHNFLILISLLAAQIYRHQSGIFCTAPYRISFDFSSFLPTRI
mmetsp:Transcript_16325/g.27584  ORF Transcript_16325/g.27584 Transcript_16325/m.27584 type:complete len:84 (+) Transcript_16325:1889-2140(+)